MEKVDIDSNKVSNANVCIILVFSGTTGKLW